MIHTPLSTRSREPCSAANSGGGTFFDKMKGAFGKARGSPDTGPPAEKTSSLEASLDTEPVIIDRIAALPQKAKEPIVSTACPHISSWQLLHGIC